MESCLNGKGAHVVNLALVENSYFAVKVFVCVLAGLDMISGCGACRTCVEGWLFVLIK